MTDKEVVLAFLENRRASGCRDLEPVRFPDEVSRRTADIDATAGSFAIEHTSVDTVADQRRDGSIFRRIATPLEEQFANLPFRLELIFPYDGLRVGQDWASIRNAVQDWIATRASSLPDGSHEITVSNVPFPFVAQKSTDASRARGAWFGRFEPDDATLAGRLVSQVARKVEKLRPYREQGSRTVLIVESDDIALMSPSKLRAAIHEGLGRACPDGLDELWYADTSAGSPSVSFERVL